MGDSFIEEEVHDFPLLVGQSFDSFMELGPVIKIVWLVLGLMQRPATFVCWLMVRMVVFPNSILAVVEPPKINEFPTNLDGGEVEEVPNTRDFHTSECPMKTDKAVLKNIVGLQPPPKVRPAVEHFSSESKQSVTGVVQQLVFGTGIPVQGQPQ